MNPIVKIILGLGCAFAAGYLTATWVPGPNRQETGSTSVVKHGGNTGIRSNSPESRIRERPAVRSTGSSSEEILEALFKKRPADALSAEGAVSDDICDYLSITRVERAGLDEAIRAAKQELQAEQRKQLRSEDAKDGERKFIISSFPEKGTAEKEKLYTRISATLGAERALLFMRVGKESLRDSFLDFGASETKITIKTQVRGNEKVYETSISLGNTWRRFETPGVPQLLHGVIELE